MYCFSTNINDNFQTYIPKPTLSDVASRFNQNPTQDKTTYLKIIVNFIFMRNPYSVILWGGIKSGKINITNSVQGKYIWIKN